MAEPIIEPSPLTDDIDNIPAATTITPGPWRAIEPYGCANANHTYWEIQGGKGFFGSDGHGFALSSYISPPDARLIAAAPRLLAALKFARPVIQAHAEELLRSFCVLRNGEPDRATMNGAERADVAELESVLEQIDAAIKQAEGG